jgi:hypothetical protein
MGGKAQLKSRFPQLKARKTQLQRLTAQLEYAKKYSYV